MSRAGADVAGTEHDFERARGPTRDHAWMKARRSGLMISG
jgi:hypothetical protein